jgi:hypothetical protein
MCFRIINFYYEIKEFRGFDVKIDALQDRMVKTCLKVTANAHSGSLNSE